MKSSILSLLSLAAFTIAAPPPAPAAPGEGNYPWTPTLAGYYEQVAQHIQEAKGRPGGPGAPSCDLSQATLPVAPTPLPSPDGLRLAHVALGRGVQNYTCTAAGPSATPAAIGAVARLYNASCVAATYPDLLELMPALALDYPLPVGPAEPQPVSQVALSGHHFFSTNTTPVFELNSGVGPNAARLGTVVGKKGANSTAPPGAPLGPGGKGFGTVAWLQLGTTEASVNTQGKTWDKIYRVNTAGGSPPKTCEGKKAGEVFSIEYAANYWYYETS